MLHTTAEGRNTFLVYASMSFDMYVNDTAINTSVPGDVDAGRPIALACCISPV